MADIDPRQVQALLKNQTALRQTLSDPQTQTLLRQLQQRDPSQLQAAARSAMAGDPSALSGILRDLSRDPDAARAMEQLDRKFSK